MTRIPVVVVGQRFGRWLVKKEARSRRYTQSLHKYWLCRCDCGSESEVSQRLLRNGQSLSCGCYHSEVVIANNVKHGMSKTAIYKVWRGMRSRCEIPSATTYSYYGGRGIGVCDRWRSFENFYADMGDAPVGMSLDRIDPNGNYEPGNCRWADFKMQARNTRKNCCVNPKQSVVDGALPEGGALQAAQG